MINNTLLPITNQLINYYVESFFKDDKCKPKITIDASISKEETRDGDMIEYHSLWLTVNHLGSTEIEPVYEYSNIFQMIEELYNKTM